MHDIHKTLYLMAKRDEDLLNEGLKAKVAAGAILGGVALGMIPPPGTPAKAPAGTPTETAPGTLVQTTPKPPTVAPPVYADADLAPPPPPEPVFAIAVVGLINVVVALL